MALICNGLFLLQPEDPSSPVSLVQGKLASFEPAQRQSTAGVVPWSPPQVNWNPWTSSNIDEGPLAFVSPLFVQSFINMWIYAICFKLFFLYLY